MFDDFLTPNEILEFGVIGDFIVSFVVYGPWLVESYVGSRILKPENFTLIPEM